MRRIDSLEQVLTLSGQDLGVSGWLELSQERIDLFAEASDDHQWIHVDQQRASAGPFGGTIAHGYLTLAIVVPLLWELVEFPAGSMTVNYGLNKVRFPAPVAAGARVRLWARIVETAATAHGVEVVLDPSVEIEHFAKPACVAQAVYRLI